MEHSFYDLSFPIAEVAADGTCIIQKQPNQNGMKVLLIVFLAYCELTFVKADYRYYENAICL
jgi:hypothetical protein